MRRRGRLLRGFGLADGRRLHGLLRPVVAGAVYPLVPPEEETMKMRQTLWTPDRTGLAI